MTEREAISSGPASLPVLLLVGLVVCELIVIVGAVLSETVIDGSSVYPVFSMFFLGFLALSVASLILLIGYALFARQAIETRRFGFLALVAALLWLPTVLASTSFSY